MQMLQHASFNIYTLAGLCSARLGINNPTSPVIKLDKKHPRCLCIQQCLAFLCQRHDRQMADADWLAATRQPDTADSPPRNAPISLWTSQPSLVDSMITELR
ncbi:hypothetical protein AWENTII_008576 [Aspergillus wentii]